MNRFAVIVAGGSGQRFGSTIPKQFLLLGGMPLLMHSIRKFSAFCKSVVVVLPEGYLQEWEKLCRQFSFEIPHITAVGGCSRSASVLNGLNTIEEKSGLVAIHDAARPLVSESLIEEVFSVAGQFGNAVPCIPVKDSIRFFDGKENKSVNRDNYRLIQTPQCFSLTELSNAFMRFSNLEFSDEASLIEKAGIKVHLVDGELENIKITTKTDLSHAEIFFNQKSV